MINKDEAHDRWSHLTDKQVISGLCAQLQAVGLKKLIKISAIRPTDKIYGKTNINKDWPLWIVSATFRNVPFEFYARYNTNMGGLLEMPKFAVLDGRIQGLADHKNLGK